MTQLEVQKSLEEAFRSVLERLEIAAGTPLVPGEMESWLQELDVAFAETRSAFAEQRRQSHAPQLGSIKREDPEMFRHVEQLQQEDAAIAESIEALQARAGVLKPMVHRIEPDEKRAELALTELGEQGVQLVARIRKQEVALRTWLQEAFTRDRGVVD